jgi:hypothetical protein
MGEKWPIIDSERGEMLLGKDPRETEENIIMQVHDEVQFYRRSGDDLRNARRSL